MLQCKQPKLTLSGTESDAELIHPETENFQEIFFRYSKPILGFIYSLLQNRSQAEDLCQETFIRALRKLDSRNKDTILSTWLFGIARNVVREAVKQKYRDLRYAAFSAPKRERIDMSAIPPDQQLMSAELHNRIQDALQTLAEDQRLVFVLKMIHKLKYEEIANITGASVSKLKTDLHRARMEMRQNLHSYLYGDNAAMRGGM